MTGPNIASQGLLFNQLSDRLRSQINGPVVTLRSGDASNFKAVLKRFIRDATNQKANEEEEEEESSLAQVVCASTTPLKDIANRPGS